MKLKIFVLIHIGLMAVYPLLPVCEAGAAERTIATASILATATNDSQLGSMDELHRYLDTAPRSTPYLDKIELRTKTDDFDTDKQKFSLRFYPKGWGETAAAERLWTTHHQSQKLAYEERFHNVLKDRYDLVIDYLETRVLVNIEKELLVDLEDQIRVLQALGPGNVAFDVSRLIDAQDDRTAHQLKRVELEDRLTGLEHWIRQLTGCGDRVSLQTKGLITVADIRFFVTHLSGLTAATSRRHPSLTNRQMRVRLAEEAYHLEVAKHRDFIDFFDVSYDLDDRDAIDQAVSLEVAVRLPFIHKDRDDILKRRIKWMEAKSDVAEAEQKWSEKIASTHHRIMRYLDQYDVLTSRKKTGEATTSYEVYRQMDGVDPLVLLKIRESILGNDIRIQKMRFSVLRRFVDLLDLSGKLSARPLVNYLSATREGIH